MPIIKANEIRIASIAYRVKKRRGALSEGDRLYNSYYGGSSMPIMAGAKRAIALNPDTFFWI
ncbi:MAG: hypothetical protein F6J93_34865 [Oscillatoria sp. SIO1A7]|nr:hypothetical protein [Oscillatoria sp. SIO1A7]